MADEAGATPRERTSLLLTSGGKALEAISANISTLQASCNRFTKGIELERRKAEELDRKIRISATKIEETRVKTTGLDEATAMRARARAERAAEHRLDVLVGRVNTVSKHNEGLRAKIESLRKDKLHRTRVFRQLEREADMARERLEATGVETAAAHEAKVAAERESAALQTTMKREGARFEADLMERITAFTAAAADRKRAADHELIHGLSGTMRPISSAGSARSSAAAGAAAGGSGAGGTTFMTAGLPGDEAGASNMAQLEKQQAEEQQGSMTVQEEMELKHRSVKTLWEVAQHEVEVRAQAAKLTALEDAFGKIQEATGIGSIEEMVAAFVAAEDRNYALLSMINDCNKEIHASEVENGALRAAVKDVRTRGGAGAAHRSQLQQRWDDELQRLHTQAYAYEEAYTDALKLLDTLRPGIHALFMKAGCAESGGMGHALAAAGTVATPAASSAAVTGVVGVDAASAASTAGAGDGSLVAHLGTIETRVVEMMHLVELSLLGVPLTLPTVEEEKAATSGDNGDAAGGSARPPGSAATARSSAEAHSAPARVPLPLEISRVGVLTTNNEAAATRPSRKVSITTPAPPSMTGDLDDDSGDDGVWAAGGAASVASGVGGRASSRALPKGRTDQDQHHGPMTLEQLRRQAIAAVRKRLTKAKLRSALVHQSAGDMTSAAAPARTTTAERSVASLVRPGSADGTGFIAPVHSSSTRGPVTAMGLPTSPIRAIPNQATGIVPATAAASGPRGPRLPQPPTAPPPIRNAVTRPGHRAVTAPARG